MNLIHPRRYRIDFGYDGSEFFGSQRQAGKRTVQSVLEDALSRLANDNVTVALAGRTDRGVHAVGQVASTQLSWSRSDETLRYGLQSLTPSDVVVTAIQEVEERFHARFDAREREYRYRIWQGLTPPIMLARYVWHVRTELDLNAMTQASGNLPGRRDFSAVAGAGVGVPGSETNCERHVFQADWREVPQEIEPGSGSGTLLEFRIKANAFLPHMVRNIVGDLVAIGRRERTPVWIDEILQGRDRRAGAPTAPPQGLVLWKVSYSEDDESSRGVAVSDGARGDIGVTN